MSDLAITTDTIPVVDPSSGERIGEIPAGGPADADAAVARARAGAARWAAPPPSARQR